MRYNSTIQPKKKTCKSCGKTDFIFSKGRCKQCATIESTMERMEEQSEITIEKEKLSDLIPIADEIYSKWLRKSSANEEGMAVCFTCDTQLPWEQLQCGHYIKRGALFLRHDPRNTRCQCENCNVFKGGKMAEYTRRLEKESPGITSYLKEEAMVVYKPTREEIHSIISEYKRKLKQLK